jgi:hypothetical protein
MVTNKHQSIEIIWTLDQNNLIKSSGAGYLFKMILLKSPIADHLINTILLKSPIASHLIKMVGLKVQ